MASYNGILRLFAGVAAGAALAACSTPAPPPPPPLPPALTPPPITLSDRLIQDAAAYSAYMARISAIAPDFKSGDDVAGALRAGDRYDPQQLLRGAIAYAAIVALQDKNFVAQVQVFAANPVSRPLLTDDIARDPNYVLGLKGADTAAALVSAALIDQGTRLHASGELVKQSAYSIQRQSWSQQLVVNRDQRLIDAKTSTPMTPSSTDAERLRQASVGTAPMSLPPPAPSPQPNPPVVVRGLALAALAVLGEAGEDQVARTDPIVAGDHGSWDCLTEAKLNLYQCLAVSRPHYEDIFCLGQHVMMDTGQCLMVAAGSPPPLYAPLAHSTTEVAYSAPGAGRKKKHHKK